MWGRMKTPMRVVSVSLAMLALWCVFSLPAWAAVITRGPYLQLQTSGSIVVRWRTDVPTKSRIYYGDTPGSQAGDVKSQDQVTEHEVQITGLDPDTRYYYSVGTFSEVLAGGDADHFFETAPFVGDVKPTRVWILGDSGTTDQNAMAVRDAYYGFTGSRHTDLWLMLGDNAYPDGTDSSTRPRCSTCSPEMLRKSVLWPTIGNHDATRRAAP